MGAQAVDMESYPIAQIASERDIPLAAVRCISDIAGSGTEETFKMHFQASSEKLQKFILEELLIKPGFSS